MSTGQPLETGVVRAACQDCGWTLERRLDESGLSPEDNQEIAARVARSHEFRCHQSGEGWGDRADVDVRLDATGGDA